MRLRQVKNQNEKINKNMFTVNYPAVYKGQWTELFGNDNPLWLEIGMGLGGFLEQISKRNTNINFIGIERYSKVLVRALRKFEEEELSNVKLLRFDANDLLNVFDSGELNRIILNFSDPWPKRRHAERRLTHPSFLDIYEKVLSKNGEIHFKTDNNAFFEYSLETLREKKWNIKYYTYDLHSEDVENVMTEYEMKFSSEGTKINKLIATR